MIMRCAPYHGSTDIPSPSRIIAKNTVSAARDIIRLEGVSALFGRGLPVRLLTNGLQGIIFSILWRRFADL